MVFAQQKVFIEIGKTYGQLTVVQEGPRTKSNVRTWICRCKCGATVQTEPGNLATKAGPKTEVSCKDCGNIRSGLKRRIHGKSGSTEYTIWHNMRNRCLDSRHRAYPRYGGRGIKICKRWDDVRLFIKDMGLRPSMDHTLDRKDNDGPYCKDNCTWSLRRAQQRNREYQKLIKVGNRSMLAVEWSEITGINHITISSRIRLGWPPKDAATQPVMKGVRLGSKRRSSSSR